MTLNGIEIENHFQTKTTLPKEEESKSDVPKKNAVVILIDRKKATNCSIMLSQFKFTFAILRDAINDLNEDLITEEQVGHLLEFAPVKEDIDAINDYTGDKSMLGKAEQFMIEVMKVPGLISRLKAWRFKRRFSEKINDITPDLKSILSASQEIRSSEKLNKVLELVLALGNYLNGGTARGGAFGFKLEILTKLRDTRSQTAKFTLLHYAAKLCETLQPEISHFNEDLPHVAAASKVSVVNYIKFK